MKAVKHQKKKKKKRPLKGSKLEKFFNNLEDDNPWLIEIH